ncbi:hypothetical protein [Salinimonas iocasae]|uniref:Uncharacterized protein n=1 Tax=Salinimonas iocasae TaxID=2572577 RepID=A0A5B7YHG0_9ALTE|nr:hypothetical protein [Salinimonas iocasae]QCZ94673.1 hypothetical protein FBQ74_14885 [Salinimonas iocasae]
MNEYFRLFLALLLHISCFATGFSIFNMTGLNPKNPEPSMWSQLLFIVIGLGVIVYISTKSEEPFKRTLVKLLLQSLEWLFLLLSLTLVGKLFSDKTLSFNWFLAAVAVATTMATHKLKNSKWLNAT